MYFDFHTYHVLEATGETREALLPITVWCPITVRFLKAACFRRQVPVEARDSEEGPWDPEDAARKTPSKTYLGDPLCKHISPRHPGMKALDSTVLESSYGSWVRQLLGISSL